MSEARKPTVRFWITVTLVSLLVGYPLSFGPACWIATRVSVQRWQPELIVMTKVYHPVWAGIRTFPAGARRAARWYVDVGLPDGVEMWHSSDSISWCLVKMEPCVR